MKNTDFDWLTYETLFNVRDFRKTNGELALGLYVVPRGFVDVFFRNDLEPLLVKRLTEAFFPDEPDAAVHLEYSNLKWSWKETARADGERHVPSPEYWASDVARYAAAPHGCADVFASLAVRHLLFRHAVWAGRSAVNLTLDARVVLPYNHLDNRADSLAMGTKPSVTVPCEMLERSRYKWKCWKTASRSCVLRIDSRLRTDLVAGKTGTSERDFCERDFEAARSRDAALRQQLSERFDANVLSGDRYRLGSAERDRREGDTQDFSIKLGATYFGDAAATRANPLAEQSKKECLEDNAVLACLRSDHIADLDRQMGLRGGAPRADIVVLTELMCVFKRFHAKLLENKYQACDGIQIRDLRPLRRDRIYVPPLSIPFLDLDLETRTSEFQRIGDARWRDFWKRSWAVSLGRAKALLLLRYALQSINPHAQNYLLEFSQDGDSASAPSPTGRVFIRDLSDLALHREVAWALWGPDGETAPAGPLSEGHGEHATIVDKTRSELKKLTRRVLRSEFDEYVDSALETGTQPSAEYAFTGTQLLWQKFSSFPNPSKFERFKQRMRVEASTLAEFSGAVDVDDAEWDARPPAPPPAPPPSPAPVARPAPPAEPSAAPPAAVDGSAAPADGPRNASAGAGDGGATTESVPPAEVAPENIPLPPPLALEDPAVAAKREAAERDAAERMKKGNVKHAAQAQEDAARREAEAAETRTRERDFRKFWKTFLTTMNDWGRSHDRAYVRTIESELGVDLMIDWADVLGESAALRPGKYLQYALGEVDDPYQRWEQQIAGQIHDFLCAAGRFRGANISAILRAYHHRRWKAAMPSFTLTFSRVDGTPAREHPVRLRRRADRDVRPSREERTWTDMTDEAGAIQIFAGPVDEYSILDPAVGWRGVREYAGARFESRATRGRHDVAAAHQHGAFGKLRLVVWGASLESLPEKDFI